MDQEIVEQYGPSALLQFYTGELTCVIDGIGVSGHCYSGDDTTLWHYVGGTYAEHATSLRRVAVFASPDDFEIIFFSRETKLLQVRMLFHRVSDGYEDHNRVPGLPDLSLLDEDDDEIIDDLCDMHGVDREDIEETLEELFPSDPSLN